MKEKCPAVETGAHFSAVHLGPLSELMQYSFFAPALGRSIPGKVFLKELLGLTGVEMSWTCFPPGAGMPFLHAHREHEEVFLFLSGQGEFLIDDQLVPVGPGTVVRVAPAGARAYRNTGAEPLYFIVLQVRQGSLQASTVEDGVPLEGALNWG